MIEKVKELISRLLDTYATTSENSLAVLGAHDILISAFGGHQFDSQPSELQVSNSRCHTLLITDKEAMDKLLGICCRADSHNLA